MLKKLSKTRIVLIVIGALIVVYVIYRFSFGNTGSQNQFVTVTRGTITETVDVTGNTTPVKSLSLAFESGGTIAAVNEDVGAQVTTGNVLVRLDTRDLQAQLAQAEANVDAQKAQLASLQSGAQPADIQSSQAALAKGQQDLANLYSGIPTAATDAFAKANDAVRNQLSAFFTSAETSNPQLTFSISNSQTQNNLIAQRVAAGTELNAWQNDVTAVNAGSSQSDLDAILQKELGHISVINQFLTTASAAIVQSNNLSSSTQNSYKSALSSAITEMSSASTNINSIAQNIASQKLTVTQLQAQLNLKLAGSTADQIQNQQANVEAAQANAQVIQVKIAKATLVSPINGVVTVQNAKVGQIASPGASLVSIISDSDLEVDAQVPETDIGKVSVGDPVSMTLDAFPGETFSGKVFYIDPAQTVVNGVVDYVIKVSFDKADARIKSGLTANLTIDTKTDTGALILPQFAIIQNTSGTFVEVLQNGTQVQVPVMLGVHDQDGNVEVASGVTEGEQVINIGLKKQ